MSEYPKPEVEHPPADPVPTKIVVRLRDDVAVPYEDGIDLPLGGPWSTLSHRFPGLDFFRLFFTVPPDRIRELQQVAAARTHRRPVDLTKYFRIRVPAGADPDVLVRTLSAARPVARAYIAGGPGTPPIGAQNDPLFEKQGYLQAAPDGIDAVHAWTVPGGDGSGVGFVDLEQGWILNHEDLGNVPMLPRSVNKDFMGHGAAVLGIVSASDNTVGIVGIAPKASTRVVSQWRDSGDDSVEDAIVTAYERMPPGDVLLLEAQTPLYERKKNLPVEVEEAIFSAILEATGLGIVVVECAGNGWKDLDDFEDSVRGRVLDRTHADFQDSFAILVGAAESAVNNKGAHASIGGRPSNRGNRVDCYAWGENVTASGNGNRGTSPTNYTHGFSGTSSAGAIVAGAAVAVQGAYRAKYGRSLTSREMRDFLGHSTNTPSAKQTDKLGVMPDLRAILNRI